MPSCFIVCSGLRMLLKRPLEGCSCSYSVRWLDQERSALLSSSTASGVFFQHLPFPASILTTGCSSRQWSAIVRKVSQREALEQYGSGSPKLFCFELLILQGNSTVGNSRP